MVIEMASQPAFPEPGQQRPACFPLIALRRILFSLQEGFVQYRIIFKDRRE